MLRFIVRTVLSIAAVMGATPHALAQGRDGSFMLQACGAALKQADGGSLAAEEAAPAIYCVSYVAGFLDGMSLATGTSGAKRNVCLPERGISNDQAIRIFVKFLREHPEGLHESGRSSLYISLARAFPCK